MYSPTTEDFEPLDATKKIHPLRETTPESIKASCALWNPPRGKLPSPMEAMGAYMVKSHQLVRSQPVILPSKEGGITVSAAIAVGDGTELAWDADADQAFDFD